MIRLRNRVSSCGSTGQPDRIDQTWLAARFRDATTTSHVFILGRPSF